MLHANGARSTELLSVVQSKTFVQTASSIAFIFEGDKSKQNRLFKVQILFLLTACRCVIIPACFLVSLPTVQS